MFKITGLEGLNKLANDMDEATKAMESIDGEIGAVQFQPDDAESIEHAIQQAEMLIDDRLSSYSSNPIVNSMIDGLKEKFRDAILEKASQARLKSGEVEGEDSSPNAE